MFYLILRRTLVRCLEPRSLPYLSLSYLQVVAVPDLFLTAVKLRHDKTGAQYLHAARDDANNLFR